jgi:RHS repeat-associated protein
VWRNLPTTEPYGNSPPETDPQNTGHPFIFNLAHSGYYRDQETGMWYAAMRDMYGPTRGAFPQSDPIGLQR